MANTSKYTGPGSNSTTRNHSIDGNVPVPVATDPSGHVDTRLSPRVEALRKLVASGQYQVSPRYLAYRIMRAAGVKPE